MFELSVGDKLPDVTGEGMRVTPGPDGLIIEVICDKQSEFARTFSEGAPFQLAFFDAKPLGRFLLNAGSAGFFDCCWAIAAVPSEFIDMMRSVFREMKDKNKESSWEEGAPAVLILADLTGEIFEIIAIAMDQNSWHLLAKTYLSHPTATDQKELSKQQARFERRYQKITDYQLDRAVWVQNYNPVLRQLGPEAQLH